MENEQNEANGNVGIDIARESTVQALEQVLEKPAEDKPELTPGPGTADVHGDILGI